MKGNTTARGYGASHQQQRQRWATVVATGHAICWRCTKPILPGTPWDLGHDDNDRRIYKGPEHRNCNRSAGGRSRHRKRTNLTW